MSSKINNMELDSVHTRLETPDFLISEKDLVEAADIQNKAPSDYHSNLSVRDLEKDKLDLENIDYKIIQAIREAGL